MNTAVRGYSKFVVINFLQFVIIMWQTDELEAGTTLATLPKCGYHKKHNNRK